MAFAFIDCSKEVVRLTASAASTRDKLRIVPTPGAMPTNWQSDPIPSKRGVMVNGLTPGATYFWMKGGCAAIASAVVWKLIFGR